MWLERQDKMPLTLNIAKQSRQLFRIHAETKDWRAWAKKTAQDEDMQPMRVPVTVTATHLRKNRGAMPDTGAPILAVKAVIDGLVDAGVLPEDGPSVVRRLVFEAPEVVGFHGLRVVVREVES